MNENEFQPVESKPTAQIQVEQTRAVQEVQSALVIAKKFPRDTNQAFTNIINSCKRISLAQGAMYQYPRGGEIVTGPSIRMAEVLAQNWGNLDFGVRELERRIDQSGKGVSIAESYCWDLETNTRQTKTFEVPHEMHTKKGTKRLTDPRDIYELVANNGARRLRACILGIIPGDVVDAAVAQCRATVAKGTGEPIEDRIRKMLLGFKDLGVTQEMIEKKLGHEISLTTPEEIADLTAVFQSIRDKQAKRTDFFEFENQEDHSTKISEFKNSLKGEKT